MMVLLLVVFQAAVNEDRIGKSRGSKQAQIASKDLFTAVTQNLFWKRY
ncbi:MAG: hypothetical protein R3A13_08530 [Bdellovibrionota bacterium]